jgi:hypothetical protein
MMLRRGRGKAAVIQVAVLVLLFHAVWIGAYLGSGHDVRDFTDIGPHFIQASRASSVISDGSIYRYGAHHNGQSDPGYDGQFYYFIALDPTRARHYIDAPPYRYERILYPMLARFAALEQPAAVPWAMLLINWLAVGGGVLALAAWLSRRGVSPWLALLYGLFPGVLIALQRDLTEPLAYGLVALAVYLFDFGGRRGVLASGAAFGLAALTRETTVLFAILFGASILAGRPNANPHPELRARMRQTLGFFALAIAPFATWIIVDYSWLGIAHPGTVELVPFKGIFGSFNPTLQLACVGVPALLFSAVQLRGASMRTGQLERLCLLANTALAVVFSTGALWINYDGLSRAAIAVVLAALLCMPYLPTRPASTGSIARRLLSVNVAVRASFALWMTPLVGALYYAIAGGGFLAPH